MNAFYCLISFNSEQQDKIISKKLFIIYRNKIGFQLFLQDLSTISYGQVSNYLVHRNFQKGLLNGKQGPKPVKRSAVLLMLQKHALIR